MYMREHAWGNATAEDLVKSLGEAAEKDVATPFNTFLTQPGLPFVKVEPECEEGGSASLELSQGRYLPVGSEGDSEQSWKFPMCVKYAAGGETKEQCTMLTEAEATMELEAEECPRWVLPNAGGAGYFRFALPSEDFEALREQSDAAGDDPPLLPEADPEDVAERAVGEGETWAALMEISVGAVKPSFETVVSVVEREFPTMTAEGDGSASSSSFEMKAGMTLEETDAGDWWAEADVFGRIAQMGQRVINPVANRVVNRFFSQVESQLSGVGEDEGGFRERIRDLI
jgi:aminopeptidase N